MANAWLCSVSLLFLLAGLCDATTDYNILDFAMARRHELWMAEYGKVYSDEAEKAQRFEVFKNNVKYIEDFNNAGNHSHTLGLNEFADLTSEEVVARYTGAKAPESLDPHEYDEGTEPLNLSPAPIPSSVDWRDDGAVSSVKNQGSCPCCWAFAAAATTESLVKIKTGVLYNLSVQQLVDCDKGNKHCQPGYIEKAYKYIKGNGLTTWANYPYRAVAGVCDKTKAAAPVATISGFRLVTRNIERKMMAAVAMQPIGVHIDASSRDFHCYKGGIFRGPCGTHTHHVVTIVGYGSTGSTKYWIVKNSWGVNWGESGYIRMERQSGRSSIGLCAIAKSPIYPIIRLHEA